MTPCTQSRAWMWWYAAPSSILVAAFGFALGACAPVPTTQKATTTQDTTASTQPPFNILVELKTDSVSGNCSAQWKAMSTDSTIDVSYQVASPAGLDTGTFLDSAIVTWAVPESVGYNVSWSMSTSFWSARDSFAVAPHSCPGKDSI
jgi:hypothetical protein